VEKGDYYAEPDFHGQEALSNENMYERGGLLTTVDMGFSVLAGSVLGGGTTVNWAASIPTPAHVLQEWAREYGFSAATSAAYQASAESVAQRINVTHDHSQANPQNALLEKGCTALGHSVQSIARNVKGCGECGFCGYGCVAGAKQGTLRTYLQDAYERGTRIITQASVERVLYRHGIAEGASVRHTSEDGQSIPLTIRAKIVVVAAGAIHTPALLLRSGLGNAHIGANLHLHPVTAVFSRFDTPVRGWHGAPMTRVSFALSDLDGRGYGVWLETAPNHPGIAAQAFPWVSGRSHKEEMQHLENYANIIVLTRDYHGGRVKTDKHGQPRLHYQLSAYDERHLMLGLIEALKAHREAGAAHLYGPHNHLRGYSAQRGSAAFDAFLQQVQAAGLKANAAALFSAHQMSSCRIGGSSATGAISPTGESYEVRNLFVADGSSLPTAVGVNPMLSIMTAAHYIAQHIRSRV
jgi:choline dehydrogenase-like flavoprotein